jgi:hypothetical protein
MFEASSNRTISGTNVARLHWECWIVLGHLTEGNAPFRPWPNMKLMCSTVDIVDVVIGSYNEWICLPNTVVLRAHKTVGWDQIVDLVILHPGDVNVHYTRALTRHG